MLARQKMHRLALSAVGLGAAPDVAERYLDLVGPGESDAMRAAMLTMSGCGLTVRGLWRKFGMKDPRLEAPYVPGSVITSLVAMAQEADAWTDGLDPELGVGDVVYVSEPDHVGTVVRCERQDGGGFSVTTVDGGSTDNAGRQLVVTWDRAIAADGSLTSGPLAGNGRVLHGCCSLPALASRFGGGGLDLGDIAALGAIGGGGYLLWKAIRGRLGRAR